MARLMQAVRQAIYKALTSPALSYQVNTDLPKTLLNTSVIPRSVWLTGAETAPSPLVAFAVSERPQVFNSVQYRTLRLSIWVVSSASEDECVELFEALRERLNLADDSGRALNQTPLSTVATNTNLGASITQCHILSVSAPDYDTTSKRWYCLSEFGITAT